MVPSHLPSLSGIVPTPDLATLDRDMQYVYIAQEHSDYIYIYDSAGCSDAENYDGRAVRQCERETNPMTKSHALVAIGASLLVASCGAEPDQPAEATPDAVQAAPEPAAASTTASKSPGEVAFLQCRACHNLAEGQPNLVGPNLHGIFGAKAGSKEGFAYSPALSGSGIVWDRETLDKWIEAPAAVVPGSKMAYAGMKDAERRAALLDYLEEATR